MNKIEDFVEDNTKIVVITFIIVFAIVLLCIILKDKKTYEIVECKTNGGFYERSISYKNSEDFCELTINAGGKPTGKYQLSVDKVKISGKIKINIIVENKKISDETPESFSNPYCIIKFNFKCDDVYVKDNYNRIYSLLNNVN